ncbi:hypothetical protein NIES4071_31270 [Calothrix sp. NIES-4071]|nr:hypothetical protein NIES4071_31270 [Calothrix sp. NIES-4071]BAZ57447.1 hypothetical protein NIES4105_31210 [Calothrix sp. NIES-4105]
MTYQIETDRSPKRRGVVQSIWDVGVISALVILAFSAQAGNNGQQNAYSPARPVTAAQVVSSPRDFIGKTVTIRSKPTQRLEANSFKLKDGLFSQQEPLLVVNTSGTPLNLPADNVDIQVTGRVRDFVISDIERDYNLNLNDDLYGGYVRKPVLVADNIALAPQPNQVAQAPQQYYGKTVAVTGEVEKTNTPILITLHKDQFIRGRSLPVLLTSSPKVAINKGQQVAVVGEVRPFVANDIEREYNFAWDANVKRQLEAEYQNTPVLIAEAVYP